MDMVVDFYLATLQVSRANRPHMSSLRDGAIGPVHKTTTWRFSRSFIVLRWNRFVYRRCRIKHLGNLSLLMICINNIAGKRLGRLPPSDGLTDCSLAPAPANSAAIILRKEWVENLDGSFFFK